MSVESIHIPASREQRPADAPVWQVRVGTLLSRVAAVAGIALIVALAALPAIASRNLIQDMIFVFTILTLAQLWNVLAGWGGLVSVGQQAFVGLGAYALFGGIVMAGLDPVAARATPKSLHLEAKLAQGVEHPTSAAALGFVISQAA